MRAHQSTMKRSSGSRQTSGDSTDSALRCSNACRGPRAEGEEAPLEFNLSLADVDQRSQLVHVPVAIAVQGVEGVDVLEPRVGDEVLPVGVARPQVARDRGWRRGRYGPIGTGEIAGNPGSSGGVLSGITAGVKEPSSKLTISAVNS